MLRSGRSRSPAREPRARRLRRARRPDAADGARAGRVTRQRDGDRARGAARHHAPGGRQAPRGAGRSRARRRAARRPGDALPPDAGAHGRGDLVDGRGRRALGRAARGAGALGRAAASELAVEPDLIAQRDPVDDDAVVALLGAEDVAGDAQHAKAGALVEAQVVGVGGGGRYEEAAPAAPARTLRGVLDQRPPDARASARLQHREALDLLDAGLAGRDQQQLPDDFAAIVGDEDLALRHVAVDRLVGVVGLAEEVPQAFAVAVVEADAHWAVVPRSGRAVTSRRGPAYEPEAASIRRSSPSSASRSSTGSLSPNSSKNSRMSGISSRHSSASTFNTSRTCSGVTSTPSRSSASIAGTKPIGVSSASAPPSQRSKTHFRTRELSPNPGHR